MLGGDIAPFHRFARAYDLLSPPANRAALRAGLARAERNIERVVDLGGGPGQNVRALDPPEGIVVDAARGMTEMARRNGLVAVQADAARLPLAANTVDAIVVSDALHHIGNRPAVFEEAARVLRPGGVLVVREFDPSTLRGRALVTVEHLVGFESTFAPPDDLADEMAVAGFRPSVLDRGFGYTVVGVALGPASTDRTASGTHKS